MKITSVSISVFEQKANTRRFEAAPSGIAPHENWIQKFQSRGTETIHVMHVATDEGIEGVSTVGDARYTTMLVEHLEQLRLLVVGEDPLAREYLYRKLYAATRKMFAPQGWFGAFDNCLWDIAGKKAGMPVATLLGVARSKVPCYYNFFGATPEAEVEDAKKGIALGYTALKDHLHYGAAANARACEMLRAAVPAGTVLLHDAASESYTFEEALTLGRALHALDYFWFEEPLPDRSFAQLKKLCALLDIPVLACETMMNDVALCAEWLIGGAADKMRGNGRLGVTAVMKLAALAELHGTTIEFNGPGGLFGLVNVHLCSAITASSFYEFFPGGSRDLIGKEIGLLNPPMPDKGFIAPPAGPGWGAEWDWDHFKKKRVAVL